MKSIKNLESKSIKNVKSVKGGTDSDGTGLTVILHIPARRYKGRRGE